MTEPVAAGRGRAIAGATLAPALGLGLVWLPMPGVTPEAHRLAGVLAAVVVLWVTEALPLPVTALLGAAACVVLGIAPAKDVFAPFADPLMFLFIGAFILARGIFLHGLDRRLAYGVLSLPWVGARPSRILLAFGLATALLSAWISNTATTAMMFGIGLSILGALNTSGTDVRIDPRYATALMLMTSFAASIGGLATPVGTPPNLIGIGFIRSQVGVDITFFRWMLIGIPIVVILFAFLYWYLDRMGPAGVKELPAGAAVIRREREALGPVDGGTAIGGGGVRDHDRALDRAGHRGTRAG